VISAKFPQKNPFSWGGSQHRKREKECKQRRSSAAPAPLQRHYSAATAPLEVGVVFIKIPKNSYKKIQILWGFRNTGNER